MNWETFFLDNLSLVDRAAAFVCRKYGLSGADAEDFASTARLKLLEDDYAVLRKFEGKCSLSTYLTVVIQRHYIDQKIHQWGKWRPSIRARRGGDGAILLERLVDRDGLSIGEASIIVRQKHPELDAQVLQGFAASVVVRPARRARSVERTEDMPEPVSEASAETELLSSERERAATKTSKVLNHALDRLPAEDRLIMKLRFIDAMKVSTIARMLHADQKQLYRRIDRLVALLREALFAAGVAMSDIGEMLTYGADSLQIDLGRADSVAEGPP